MRWRSAVLAEDSRLGPWARLAACVLAEYAGTGRCWPSVPTVAQHMGMGERVTYTALQRLTRRVHRRRAKTRAHEHLRARPYPCTSCRESPLQEMPVSEATPARTPARTPAPRADEPEGPEEPEEPTARTSASIAVQANHHPPAQALVGLLRGPAAGRRDQAAETAGRHGGSGSGELSPTARPSCDIAGALRLMVERRLHP